jgi:hypothetical protein
MSTLAVPQVSEMKLSLANEERETIIDPVYKKIDRNGRIYISMDLAGQEALIAVIKPKPEDKIRYIKVGRTP